MWGVRSARAGSDPQESPQRPRAPEAGRVRVAVLTTRPELPIYAEMVAAAARAGAELVILDALGMAGSIEPTALFLDGEPYAAETIAAVLPRVGNWRPGSVLAVLDAMRAAGVASLNEPGAIRRGRDHWRTIAALAAAGVPHPATLAAADPEALAAAVAAALGFPCVVKVRASRQGVGVVLCERRDQLDATLDAMFRLGEEVVVQRYCRAEGVSRRVLVLDGEVLAATEQRAPPGEFRSNAARGATVAAVQLPGDLADLAAAAAAVTGLAFAGVDLLPDGGRWLVGEVNPSPGWRHLAAATGAPVADALVAALVRRGGLR
jgi:RimK family alpha-L-glutamate ligase